MAIQSFDRNYGVGANWVTERRHGDKVLLIKRNVMKAVILRLARRRVNRDLQLTRKQFVLQLLRRRVGDLQRNSGMALKNRFDEIDQIIGRDRAHQAEFKRRLVQVHEVGGAALGVLGFGVNLLQIGLHHAPQLGQMRLRALSMEKRPAQFKLKHLDGARNRRLRYVAPFRRAREIQFLREDEKILDLVHFHCERPALMDLFARSHARACERAQCKSRS